MPAKIALFNHKGGVGKTTLTVNLSHALSLTGKKILIVDSDPQCNVSSYLLADDAVNDLLDASDESDGETVWSGLKPVVDGTGALKPLEPYQIYENLFLIPGDIKLSQYETELTPAWGGCLQRQARALNVTTALSRLVSQCAKTVEADYVFYDCGPNIGPLNRVAVLDCDFIIIPAACDLFSIRALKTLGATLIDWIQDWSVVMDVAPRDTYLFNGAPVCLGFIAQRFRLYRGKASGDYQELMPELERRLISDVIEPLRAVGVVHDNDAHLKIGEVPELGSLAQRAQLLGEAMSEVSGVRRHRRHEAEVVFTELARQLVARINV